MLLHTLNQSKENPMKKNKNLRRVLISLLVLTAVFVSAFSFAYADSSSDTSVTATSTSQSQPGNPPSGDPPSGGPGGSGGGTPPDKPDGDSSGGPGGTPPSGAPGGSGGPGGSSSADISYTGNTEFTEDTTESGQTYTSDESNVQALLASGGTSSIDKATVTKTGDSDGDESDFYGTNAAVLATSGTLNITDSEITTDGAHANAVFATGEGVIEISDSTITTTSNNSGAVMVTGGGTLTANNVTAKTSGNSSAPIRSDRGGGTMTINGGSYESNGVGSPVVYSTADVTVNNANMVSTASEGVVVEGKNSVTLNGVTMTADNNTHNGKSETYKAIFLYQSMSGDADEGTASFTAKDSEINILNGDTIFVTNTTAEIYLENNTITNESGDFLRIQTGAWGNEGSNGGTVIATLSNQRIEGDIIVDSISTLDLTLENGSKFFGAIDTDNQAQEVTLTMSADSVLVLQGDTYVDSLTNEDSTNSNIYLNGYKLYVNGEKTAANEGTYTEEEAVSEEVAEETADTAAAGGNSTLPYVIGGIVLLVLAGSAVAASKKKASRETVSEADSQEKIPETVPEQNTENLSDKTDSE